VVFLLLLLVPLLAAVGLFIVTKKTVTWQEFLIHLAISLAVAGISVGILYFANTTDVEIWGGSIEEKKKERVSCEHSYDCNCTTVCRGENNDDCSEECDTCYRHSYDYDWAYYSSDDGRNEIRRIDEQGVREPPRWTAVVVGEPSASKHRYTNYIKGAPDSLFNRQGLVEKYKGALPNYPNNVHDYYRIDRLVTVGAVSLPGPQRKQYTKLLMERNATLGSLKQASLAVVLVGGQDSQYFEALEQHWLGGKKNDVIAVIGVKGAAIEWVRIMAWSTTKEVNVVGRDNILAEKTIEDPSKIVWALSNAVEQKFVRKPMADFAYLKSSVTPEPWQLGLAAFINIAVSVGAGIFFHMNSWTATPFRRRRRWR
jgi:hypothetical protein